MLHVDLEHRRLLLTGRQLLGVGGRSERTVDEVAAQLGLLHSTDPATPHLSLHARCDADVDEVIAGLQDTSRIVRHTTIRRTVFATPLEIAGLAHHSYNGTLVDRLRTKLLGWLEASDDVDGDPARFLADVEREVVDRLGSGEATGSALADDVPGLAVTFEPSPGASWSKPMRITSKVLELLAAEGRIVRAAPVGSPIVSAAWTWAVPPVECRAVFEAALDADEALAGLLAHHLEAFAPSTVTDLAWWTGLSKTKVRTALGAIGAEEVTVDTGESVESGWILHDDPLEVTAPRRHDVALLPGLDSTVMGWKQRRWYVDDRSDVGVFDRNGNAGPTVWCDGRVVGVWTQRPGDERGDTPVVVVEWLEETGDDVVELARLEADRLAEWLGPALVKWRYPTAITKRLVG